ncbi:glycerophosphoryl diester phosphodiesterase, partial [Vibrio parahaemolyticus]|nr:glycerophosphoryl diester phosphodiesterase [Vibrio parahaemolyticus]
LVLKWEEEDVQPTKDNVLVVCHYHTLSLCSNGKGRVDAHTFEELRQLDFGVWFSDDFAGETIMTLEELLSLATERGLNLNI